MATLNPYLTFNGNCKEAMLFYKSIFGGELSLMVAGETPVASQLPEQFHSSILHSSLKTADFEIMATDMTPDEFNEGNTVIMCLVCKTEEEIYSLYEKLSAGGKAVRPLHKMFFGLIGTLADQFGKTWLLELDQPAQA